MASLRKTKGLSRIHQPGRILKLILREEPLEYAAVSVLRTRNPACALDLANEDVVSLTALSKPSRVDAVDIISPISGPLYRLQARDRVLCCHQVRRKDLVTSLAMRFCDQPPLFRSEAHSSPPIWHRRTIRREINCLRSSVAETNVSSLIEDAH